MRVWVGRALFLVGAMLVGYWFWAVADARRAQAVMEERLEQVESPTARASFTTAWETRHEAAATGLVGRIEIDHLGLKALIVDGSSPRALRRGVGHIKSSAYPGEAGNVALAGHRDSFFRKLKDLSEGDVIRITTPDGVFDYQVDSLLVVPPYRADFVAETSGSGLTLVTCYPFSWIGPAPDRFIVRARRAG